MALFLFPRAFWWDLRIIWANSLGGNDVTFCDSTHKSDSQFSAGLSPPADFNTRRHCDDPVRSYLASVVFLIHNNAVALSKVLYIAQDDLLNYYIQM